MLSFKDSGKNIAIAKVKGGKHNNKIVYLDPDGGKVTTDKGEIDKIQQTANLLHKFVCPHCKMLMSRKDALQRHLKYDCKVLKVQNYMNEYMDDLLKERLFGGCKDDKDCDTCEKKICGSKSDNIGKELLIKDKGVIMPLPNTQKREILYVAGPMGSGKSYYTGKYLESFRKLFPKKKMFLFSRVEQDESLDKIKGLKRIKLDDLNPDDFKNGFDSKKDLNNSMVVFDDIDTFNNKKLVDEILRLRDDIMKCGRDQTDSGKDIYCICTNHQVTDYKSTRDLLNECTSITLFPQSGSTYGATRCLKYYCGIGQKEIDKLLKLPSRWITIYKRFPMYCIYEKGIYLMNKD